MSSDQNDKNSGTSAGRSGTPQSHPSHPVPPLSHCSETENEQKHQQIHTSVPDVPYVPYVQVNVVSPYSGYDRPKATPKAPQTACSYRDQVEPMVQVGPVGRQWVQPPLGRTGSDARIDAFFDTCVVDETGAAQPPFLSPTDRIVIAYCRQHPINQKSSVHP